MVITHNLSAMNADRQLSLVINGRQKTTEKLSSGYRINRAADDAAGLAISEKMRSMIRGLDRGSKNTMDGISWVQVADGALNEVHDMIHRMTELAIQSANDTNTQSDREALDHELQHLKEEIDRIDKTTLFNTKNVFLQGNVELAVDGDTLDVAVFDATYQNGRPITYGGFIIDGDRYTWDQIDPGMVRVDAGTGRQYFNEGIYDFSIGDRKFQFQSEDGEAVPIITRNFEIAASSSGLEIDGMSFAWSDVKDEDGIGISSSNIHTGVFKVDYDTSLPNWGINNDSTASSARSTLYITIGDNRPVNSLDDIIDSINTGNDGVFEYHWIGTQVMSTQKAIDIYTANQGGNYSKRETIDYDMATQTNCIDASGNGDLRFTLRVDKNANSIYLEGSNGTKIDGTELTFQQMGIQSWTSGSSASTHDEYTYSDPSGKTNVEFKFKLDASTTIDSIFNGLDGVVLSSSGYTTHYQNNVAASTANVSMVNQSWNFGVNSFNAEVQMGRDFSLASQTLRNTGFTYDGAAKTLSFTDDIKDIGGNTVFDFSASTVPAETTLRNSILNSIGSVVTNSVNGTAGNYTSSNVNLQFTDGESSVTYNYKYGNYLDSLNSALSSALTITENHDNALDPSAVTSYTVTLDETADPMFSGLTSFNNTNFTSKTDAITALTNALKTHLSGDIGSYASGAMNDIAAASQYTLKTTGLSTATFSGNENHNSTSASRYLSEMRLTDLIKGINIQHSSMQGDFTMIPQFAINTRILHLAAADISTGWGADDTIGRAEYALNFISEKRATLGAVQNRLEHTYNNNQNKEENLTDAESRLRDADMAKEMVDYAKHNILTQVGQSMIAQANQSKQGVMSLLG